ncbi:uracil-DNA glycosylase [candidate division KSB1 bacterium]|nr:uracil-DNA glycosylase [candidate division KSB1 bacterium]
MISEVPSPDSKDFFYAPDNPSYLQTTLQAFNDAGCSFFSIDNILRAGVYITTAIKCGKTGYAISTNTVQHCSVLLEQEIALFPDIQVFMCIGDVAIKAMNEIAKRTMDHKVIQSGSTYKIRKEKFYFGSKRIFPSYLQTGKNYLIEKSKRKMIAEDIKDAFDIINLA